MYTFAQAIELRMHTYPYICITIIAQRSKSIRGRLSCPRLTKYTTFPASVWLFSLVWHMQACFFTRPIICKLSESLRRPQSLKVAKTHRKDRQTSRHAENMTLCCTEWTFLVQRQVTLWTTMTEKRLGAWSYTPLHILPTDLNYAVDHFATRTLAA